MRKTDKTTRAKMESMLRQKEPVCSNPKCDYFNTSERVVFNGPFSDGSGGYDCAACGSILGKVNSLYDRQRLLDKIIAEGKPCDHPGCMSHVSHPCEGCGRQWGGNTKHD